MNEWIYNSGSACYNSATEGYAITQTGVLIPGKLYSIAVTVSSMTQGKLIIDSIVGKPEITENGVYNIVGIATMEDLVFIGGKDVIYVFDGCVDVVGSRLVPYYEIQDLAGNVIFSQTDETGVTASLDNIQYIVDWSSFTDGCYIIVFSAGGVTYESDSFYIKSDHAGTIQLTWTNNDNAFGFDYTTLLFTPSLRVLGKKWHPKYVKDKEVFRDSNGDRTTLRSDTSKIEILTINEVPEYIHDAYAIGIEHDDFQIDAVGYVVEDTEHTPKWRNSSNLAPSNTDVIKKNQDLSNENCA